MDEKLVEALRAAAGPDGVLSADEVATRSAGFMRSDHLRAGLLVRPRNTEEVSAVLRLCHEHRVPVVPLGGLTGLVHGGDAQPDEIILSLERMRAIESIDPIARTATVQAGVTLQSLQEELDHHGLMFPLDLGARGSATVGGNASTNAGGNRVIRYGMMRDMVLGLEAVLADGTVVTSLNRLIKNNAGYDIKQLFLGTEGTLGVVTRLVVRLREKPESQQVALVAVERFDRLPALLKHMDRALGGALSAFEVMWQDFFDLVTSEPAKARPPLARGYGYYVIVEALGGDPASDDTRFAVALEGALERELIADAAIAKSQSERNALWAIRDDVAQVLRFGPVFIFDVSLPISAMAGYVAGVRTELGACWPAARVFVFGHLGDGNLHFAISVGADSPEVRAAVERIVYTPLRAVGGSVSAEHGIGLEKKAYLELSRSPQEIDLMKRIKQALDPNGILNPGKVFD